MEVKVCEAGSDRRIRVLGVARVSEEMLGRGDGEGWEGEVEFMQALEGKQVCVGIAHLRIARKVQASEREW